MSAHPPDTPAQGLRILIVAPQPFFSERGTPIAVKLLAETLGNLGHQVDILTYPMGAGVAAEGVMVHRCRRVPGVQDVAIGFSWAKIATDASLCLSLLALARPGRYDVVHAVEESVYPALALRPRHGAKVVYDMDSSLAAQLARTFEPLPLEGVFRAAERWAVRRADAVVTMCQDLAEHVRTLRPSGPVHVLHDVPVEPAAPEPTRDDLRRVVHGKRVALYVGNLEPYQGIDLLLDSMRELPGRLPVGLVIVGGRPEQVRHYRARAARLGVYERVTFLGRRPVAQLPSLLAQADILVSPRVEGTNTPLKIYSYMRAGRPILATRRTTHTQVLDDSTAELVLPEADAMARGLERLVRDAGRRRRLARAAAERVAEHYSREHFREAVVEAYASLAPDVPDRRPPSRAALAGD